MKNNHLTTAIKTLKKHRDKLCIERNKALAKAEEAKESAEFFNAEAEKIDAQIKSLEGTQLVEA